MKKPTTAWAVFEGEKIKPATIRFFKAHILRQFPQYADKKGFSIREVEIHEKSEVHKIATTQNSKTINADNVEVFVFRDKETGELCLYTPLLMDGAKVQITKA